MVERPIKKSERQVAEPSNADEALETQQHSSQESNVEAADTPLPEKRKVIPPVPGKEKTKGRGRNSQKEDEPSAPVNLALMRGPKPSKPKPPVVEAPPEETEVEASLDETEANTVAESSLEE